MSELQVYASPSAGYQTLVGKNGWLFICGVNKLEDQIKGTVLLSDEDLQIFEERLIERDRFCRAAGAKYLHVVVPDKSAIYPEALPDGMPRAEETVLNQIEDALSRLEGKVLGIGLRSFLRSKKNTEDFVFLQTDSHWTHRVSIDACNELIRLADMGDELAPIPPSSIVWNRKSKVFELAALLPEPYKESFDSPAVKTPLSKVVFENQARGRGRLQVYEGGGGTAKVLLFRDSFSSMFMTHLADQCAKLTAINSMQFWPELVEQQQPDLVIFQTSERFLYPFVKTDKRTSFLESFGIELDTIP